MLGLKVVHDLFINKQGITIKDLAKNLKTDYKNVHDSVSALFEEGIIKKERIGNYNICKLNYNHDDVAEYLKEYNFYVKVKEFRKKYSTEYRIIMETCLELQRKIHHLFICLIFGSYARNEEREGSDVDLLFLTPVTYYNEKEIRNVLNRVNTPYQKKFHILRQEIGDFIKDLNETKKLSIATELYKEPPTVFYGDDIFFKIMMGANKLW